MSANHPKSTESSKANKVNPRSKTEKQKSFLYAIYIFPQEENEKNILEFSKNIKKARVFYIHSTVSILETFKNVIEDEREELVFDDRINSQNDNEPFLTLLNVSIKNIQKDRAKRWKLKVNGSCCQLLVLNSNCSKSKSLVCSLQKELGEIIERESIQHILQILNVPSTRNEVENASKTHTKRKSENQRLGEKSKQQKVEKETEETTYETQEAIAEGLYKQIKAKLKEFDKIELDKYFEDFEFLIVLPNKISLEKQTIERIKKKFPKKRNPEKSVIRICPTSTFLQDKWKKFLQRAKASPTTFFLVIHDECHWAAGTVSTSKFLGFDQGDYHYPDGQLLPNLFTLMVSATPYNFFTSPHLKPEDILYWNTHLQDAKIKNNYQGLTHFREGNENCKMLSTSSVMDTWWEKNKDSFAAMLQNGFTKEFILVLLEYCTSISTAANRCHTNSFSLSVTPEVKKCVQKCIHQNKQIIVRLEAAFDEVRPTEVAKICLQAVIDESKQEVDVIVLTSSQQEQQNADAFLDNKPKIILVIEQLRMGDTFPNTCICFDLRARYLFPVQDFTSIIQDVGRAFGYNERPLLLLSKQANDFLTDIWDSSTGYISWDSLKTKLELKSVVLGQNTTRKSHITSAETINTIYINLPLDYDGEQFTIEVDPTKMVIQQFQDIYEHDPNEPVFLFRLKLAGDCKAFKHRIFLKAEPQNGKTGAFLHLAYLLEQKLGKDAYFLRKFTRTSYATKSLEELDQKLKTEEGKEEHKEYLRVLGTARENRKQNGIVEPSMWAALCLIQTILENCQLNEPEIQIADFGCGDMQFANFFCEELQKKLQEKPELAQTKFAIHAYDLSPNKIPISERLKNSNQIRIISCPGISCGEKTEFEEKSYDFIVSTLALFGNEDSWKETIQTAFFALKTNGIFILAEWDKYMPRNFAQKLSTAGIDCVHFSPGINKTIII